jgi:hypothetical protein
MKSVFVLILLAATAAFSAASISTVYKSSLIRVSSYGCQEGYSSKGTLDYDARGAINKSKTDAAQANCSINVGPFEGSYRIDAVARATNSANNKTVTCKLIEVENMSGDILAKYPNSAFVSRGSKGLLTWRDIESLSSESVLNLVCDLPAQTGLIGISVTSEDY